MLIGWLMLLWFEWFVCVMYGFDFVLIYNWGVMDVVMVYMLFVVMLKLLLLVYYEDGFN